MSGSTANTVHENIKSYEAEQARLQSEIVRLEGNPKMSLEVSSRREQHKMLQQNIDQLIAELRKLSAAEPGSE
jgi:hypothetical protein